MLKRRLPTYAKASWRHKLTAACAGNPGLGPASVVLYDVSTLYFETDAGDGFCKPGFSKARRLDPPIAIGLVSDQGKFRLAWCVEAIWSRCSSHAVCQHKAALQTSYGVGMSTTQDGIVRPGRRRPRRASTYFLILVLLVCSTGGGYLWYRGLAVRTVCVATRDLPAYHQITAADVHRSKVRSDQVPSQATANLSDLVGRYTLAPAQRGRALSLNKLGPKLPVGTLAKQLVVGIPASIFDIGGGTVARGDRVDILLSSTAADNARNGVLRGVVVLDVKPIGKEASQFVIVCAFSASDENILLAAGGTARIFVARVLSTGTP